MEARYRRPWMGAAALALFVFVSSTASAQMGAARHVAQSENFIVFATTPQLAQEVSLAAEKWRRDLAMHWLGHEIPVWSSRCPVHVNAANGMPASGETRFVLAGGVVGNWMMTVNGTRERVLDSVLPHEITHTILASHFASLDQHVPRWADEGACTTVEHDSEQSKHKYMLSQFLQQGRGISFNRLFSLKDYPHDILPLYAQGHAVVEFLLSQGGPQKFVKFLEDGMQSGQWEAAVNRSYGYSTLGELKVKWNQWLADGRGKTDLYVADSVKATKVRGSLASNVGAAPNALRGPATVRGQSPNDAESTNSTFEPGDGAVQLGEPLQGAVAAVRVPSDPPSLANLGSTLASKDSSPEAHAASGSWYRQQFERNMRAIDRSSTPPAASSAQASSDLAAGTFAPATMRDRAPVVAPAPQAMIANHDMPYQPYVPSHGVSRPNPPQSPQVQVLQWR